MDAGYKAVTSKEEPILRVSSKELKLPLSFAQERLWLLDQLEPGNTAYLIRDDQRLYGLLNLQALDRALRALVLRHETLRTTFHLQGDQLYQAIHPATSFNLPVIDLRGLASSERETVAQQLVDQEAGQPTHLERGPLLRVSLLRLDSEEYLLLLTMHHIISDGWSVRIFERELMLLYRSFADQQPAELAPLPIQYADFASWQRQWLSGALLDQQLAYWKHQLADAAPLELPTDHPRPPVQTFRGAYLPIQFPLALQNELHALCQREGVTPFMVLLASFQLLLSRYSGQSDISIGIPIANRTRTELELLIGFFVNTLVMRTDLSGNPTFQALLQRVREVALGAYAHQDVPFEHLVEVLHPIRDVSRSPLFQVMFSLQNYLHADAEVEGLSFSALETRQINAKFDLSMTTVNDGHSLQCSLEYNTDLFQASTISRLLHHWQRLLVSLSTSPSTAINAVQLLSDEERHLAVVTWNETATEQVDQYSLSALFEQQAARTPDAIAVVYAEPSFLPSVCAARHSPGLRTQW